MNSIDPTPTDAAIPTPRTDAEADTPDSYATENAMAERLDEAARKKFGRRYFGNVVPADFARQLERELHLAKSPVVPSPCGEDAKAGIDHALFVIRSKRLPFKSPVYLAALDDMETSLLAALERIAEGRGPELTAVVQSPVVASEAAKAAAKEIHTTRDMPWGPDGKFPVKPDEIETAAIIPRHFQPVLEENERLRENEKYYCGSVAARDGDIIALRVDLATLNKELEKTKAAEARAKSGGAEWCRIANKALTDLAQCQRERDEACKVLTDLKLGPPGGRAISKEMRDGLNDLNEAAAEQYSKLGNLEKK